MEVGLLPTSHCDTPGHLPDSQTQIYPLTALDCGQTPLFSVSNGVGTGGQGWARLAPLNAASQLLTLKIAPGPPAAGYGMVLLNLSSIPSWIQSPLAG